MKSFNLLVLAAALFIALPASAQQVKPYHQNIKDCAACHTKENAVGRKQFVTPDNKACLTCHQSYAAVAEKTKNLKNGEPNPHASHHYGEGIGGTAKLQGNYGVGKIKEGSRDYSMYSIATAYEYPISKRTLFYSFAGYGQGKKAASSIEELNSWTISAGLSHSF